MSGVRARRSRRVGIRFRSPLCYIEQVIEERIAFFEQASKLLPSEQAELAWLLLETLESQPAEGHEEAWASEVERRIAELDSGAVKAVPWETAKAKLLARARES